MSSLTRTAILKKAVHLIPYDGIGGVEIAAKSLTSGVYEGLEFHKYFLADKTGAKRVNFQDSGSFDSENDPRNYIRAIGWLIKLKPDVIIVSLWRSCVVCVLFKLFRPRTKSVVFLHLATDVHFPDKFFTRLAMTFATEIWADSEATRQARIPKHLRYRSRVISFVVEPVVLRPIPLVRPKFIFWGRLQAQKGLDAAIDLFARIKLEHTNASFTVIGPDGGQRSQLLQQVAQLGIGDSVDFLGPMSRSQISQLAAEHSFYLQTSIVEGMAMSVVEAMQLGLAPVVTPVGEIANYCKDGESAVFVSDMQETVARVSALLENPAKFLRIAAGAQAVWQGRPLYRDDVLAACGQILALEVSACAD